MRHRISLDLTKGARFLLVHPDRLPRESELPSKVRPSMEPGREAGLTGLLRRHGVAGVICMNFTFWLIAVLHELVVRGPFLDLGGDWARFWGAARAFHHISPAAAYQLPQIAIGMQPLAPYVNSGAGGLRPGPAPYPPIFLEVVSLFVRAPPIVGFALWTAFNASLAFMVVRQLALRFRPERPALLGLALLSSFPFMLSFFTGQIVVLLVVCLLQSMREFERDREMRAGIWLGLLNSETAICRRFARGSAVQAEIEGGSGVLAGNGRHCDCVVSGRGR